MKVRILWAGKTKEKFAAEGIQKYLGMLRPLVSVEVVELKEHRGCQGEEKLKKEGQRILKGSSSYILLDERGRELSSEEFADMLKDRAQVDFVVGGPYGVSGEVRSSARETVALSRMTLTHDFARLLLLEQLYRAVTILRGGSYHH